MRRTSCEPGDKLAAMVFTLALLLVIAAAGYANRGRPSGRRRGPPQSISLAEARAIIDAAIAYACQTNRAMGVLGRESPPGRRLATS